MRRSRVLALALACCVGAAGGARAGDWQAGAGPEWQRLLAAARAEGAVAVAGTPLLARPFADGFKRDTGLDLQYLGSNPADMEARIDREAKAGTITIDMVLTGATGLVTLLPAGLLNPIRPQLVLPSVTDPKQWQGDKLHWVDDAGDYMFEGSRYIVGWPVVNADLVDPSAIHTWQDLLKPEYKGKIAVFDPRTAGPGQGAAGYLEDRFGIDFVKRLYIGQDVRYVLDSRQLVELAARGAAPILIGAIQSIVEQYKRAGIKLVALAPADGPGYLSSGFSVLEQLKGAVPHPNAATVFANWYGSAAGQTIYSSTMLEVSARRDVPRGEIPDYVVPKPGIDYPDTYTEAWYTRTRPKVSKAVIEALGGP